MNTSERIQLVTGATTIDKHIQVKLEQDIDQLQFMTLNIYTKDIYQDFNSDYGVLVGRVVANGGVGIPNAKISIFIPLSDEDALDGEITSIYPYKTPRDKNAEGKRYNLLPRVSEYDPQTGTYKPHQPFGSFPIKPEIVTNVSFLNIYKKYYKYTALTNNAGDYMIFGVPIGVQTVHLSVDITDIGKYSMTPAAMVTNLGYSPNLFYDNNSKIKPSNDLNDLPNIETQEISVDVVPFWGDTENFIIGITRQDFRIRSTIANTFVIFGSAFTDGDNAMWGQESAAGTRRISELFRARTDANITIGMASKRIGIITEKIYYYPANISDDDINNNLVDPATDMVLLDKSQYSSYKRDGDFVLIISCNRNKVSTDELGNEVPVSNDSAEGVFTKFRGFITLEITSDAVPMSFSADIGSDTRVTPFRYTLKFPQYAARNNSFSAPSGGNDTIATKDWRKEHFTFSGGGFYSISRFHPLINNGNIADGSQFPLNNGFFDHDKINNATLDAYENVGIIATSSYQIYNNQQYQFPSNADWGTVKVFGANWMNLSVYLPQVGYMTEGWNHIRDIRVADHFTKQLENNSGANSFFLENNDQIIAANQFNTRWFARSDLNWTDFIIVPISDIKAMAQVIPKGFTDLDPAIPLIGKYRNGTEIPPGWSTPCPIDGGKTGGIPANGPDNKYYFYKGYGDANCILYLFELGLIN